MSSTVIYIVLVQCIAGPFKGTMVEFNSSKLPVIKSGKYEIVVDDQKLELKAKDCPFRFQEMRVEGGDTWIRE